MDATGRIIRNDTQLSFIHETAGLVRPARQRGSIPASLPPILKRLNININAWLEQSQHFALLHCAPAITGLTHPIRQKEYYQRFAKQRQHKSKAA